MKSEELRSIQAPLKASYREDPAVAVVTLKASGRLGEEAIVCSVQTGRDLVEAGLHPASGGDGLSLCSGDMLTERYCVVYQTLRSAPPIEISKRITAA